MLACRFLESHWFVWATQISHLAKDVDFDKERDWASLQASHTPLCLLRFLSYNFLVCCGCTTAQWNPERGAVLFQGLVLGPPQLPNRAPVSTCTVICSGEKLCLTHPLFSNSLFPTMPRHNFQLAQPRVIEFCKKHNLNYELMPLSDAFKDIIR